MPAEDIDDIILETASDPAEVQTDTGKVKGQPIPDLLALKKDAERGVPSNARSAWAGLRWARAVLPGPT